MGRLHSAIVLPEFLLTYFGLLGLKHTGSVQQSQNTKRIKQEMTEMEYKVITYRVKSAKAAFNDCFIQSFIQNFCPNT